MAAFASESGAYLYGQKLVSLVNRPQEYLAIVVGDSDGVLDRNELTFDEGKYSHTSGGIYYFGADGYMLHDTKTPDGYTVGTDGALVNKITLNIKI